MKIVKITKVIHDTPKQFYDVINANPYNNFFIATNSTFICSHNCFFDEISFIKNKDVEKQKEKANDMIDTAIGGMKTRFVHKGKNPTMLILASSKRSDKSFLEEHMKKKLKSEKTNVYISDGSVWEVKPKGTYKDETFAVAVGNKFLTSIILPEGADEKEYRLKGYVKIIHPPVYFKADFIDDIDRALCDFAGISSSSLTKYISGQAVSEVINTTLQNAFTNEILTIGTGPEDREVQYYHFFDKSRIPRELLSKPLFIHLDMSLTGDKTGIAGVFIKGKKTSVDPDLQDRDLFYTLGFAVSIKAPKGRQISFEKNRNFIRWLKDQGFIIKGISCDTYQSADLQQILKAEGFPIETLSVDRVGTNQICIPYQSFKSAIYEKRIEFFEDELLIEEITNLERNNDTGKIDHPDGGCFTGDTKVKLTDGRSLSFLELVDEYKQGKTNYVYSMNLQSKKIEPKRIVKAWKTLENQPLVRITLDNGESIECTLNHKFMLRNGEYMEAQELLPGDSLMPLNGSHEVMMLQFISKKADVYDIEVEDNHNFALDAGIFVHNSKDKSDAVCGAVYTASQYAEEFAYRYGESEALKLTVELNSSDYSSSDHEQITLAWEEELKRINGTFSSMKSQDTVNANNSFSPTENYSLWNDDIIM